VRSCWQPLGSERWLRWSWTYVPDCLNSSSCPEQKTKNKKNI
jgi:hypothetical protein